MIKVHTQVCMFYKNMLVVRNLHHIVWTGLRNQHSIKSVYTPHVHIFILKLLALSLITRTANIAVIKSPSGSEICVYLLICAAKALSATQYVGHE